MALEEPQHGGQFEYLRGEALASCAEFVLALCAGPTGTGRPRPHVHGSIQGRRRAKSVTESGSPGGRGTLTFPSSFSTQPKR